MIEIIDFVLDDIEFGGPSPLFAAFILSTGCLINGASRLYCFFKNENVFKMVLIHNWSFLPYFILFTL